MFLQVYFALFRVFLSVSHLIDSETAERRLLDIYPIWFLNMSFMEL